MFEKWFLQRLCHKILRGIKPIPSLHCYGSCYWITRKVVLTFSLNSQTSDILNSFFKKTSKITPRFSFNFFSKFTNIFVRYLWTFVFSLFFFIFFCLFWGYGAGSNMFYKLNLSKMSFKPDRKIANKVSVSVLYWLALYWWQA